MKVTPQLIKKLREQTDAPMMDCKHALDQAAQEIGEDEEKVLTRAREILREAGKAAAVKRADRVTSNGAIAIARSNHAAAAVVLLCETDFVARNEEFIRLAQKIADYFASHEIPQEPLDANIDGTTVRQLLEDAVGKIRENIRLGAVKRLTGDTVGAYLHHDKAKAALVVLEGGDGAAQELANKLGIQIVALSPEYIDKSQVEQARIEKEIEIEKQRAIEEGKKPEIAAKIAEGKVNKELLQQIVLSEQPWYAQLNRKVGDVLKEANASLKVKQFVRLEIGKDPVECSVGKT